jgi:predicted nucleic acid-binding protein
MPYLIDSTHVIYYLDDRVAAVELLDRLTLEGVAVSIITYIEVFQGVGVSPHPRRARGKFNAFFDSVPVLPISIEAAQRCARLRQTLKSQGFRVNSRALDLIIAATAIELRLTLVTNNTTDHDDIPGLRLYNP